MQQHSLKHGTGPAHQLQAPSTVAWHTIPLRCANLYRLVNHGPLAAKPAAHHELDAGTQGDAGVGLCGGWPAGEHSLLRGGAAWCREYWRGFVHQLHCAPGLGSGKASMPLPSAHQHQCVTRAAWAGS